MKEGNKMNIKRVKYQMSEDGKWEIGYIIGSYDGDNKTLLDEDFNYVPKLNMDGKEFVVYDLKTDWGTPLNLTIPI